MTYLTARIFQNSIQSSQFLRLVLISLVLITLHSTPASAQWAASGNNINNTNSGNVGIGTSAPASLLHLFTPDAGPSGVPGSGVAQIQFQAGQKAGYFGAWAGGGFFITSNRSVSTGDMFDTAHGGAQITLGSHYEDGNILFQTVSSSKIVTELARIKANGNVGIGTTSPTAQLHLGGSFTGTEAGDGSNSIFRVTSTITALPSYDISSLKFAPTFNRASSGTHQYFVGVNIQPPTISGGAATVNNAVSLYVGDQPSGATNNYAMWIDNGTTRLDGATYLAADTGSVGIGTTTPNSSQYKLDVNGHTNVTGNFNASGTITGGNIIAKYQDVAEWVPASEQIPAGTVVVLDSTKSNHVIASTKGYDTRVAGVVSAQPGIALGESGDSKVLVATTGRVRVKVDATRSPILVGDLLVTSDVPGVAMKSEPIKVGGRLMHMPGTLIGKALEPLQGGSGTILVLLSLQ
jgi:hypothetical protein